MGPRLVSRGNALPLGTVNALGALLQWGRDSLVAEMSFTARRSEGTPPASMGPRLVSRGNMRFCKLNGS